LRSMYDIQFGLHTEIATISENIDSKPYNSQ